jgi:hypothetical protein
MQRNVGGIDQFIRLLVGLGALSLIFIGPKTWWGLLGLIPLLTASIGVCPLYSLVGISTCSVPQKKT